MMKRIAEGTTRIFLACGATDFRKQISGLAATVSLSFKLDPYNMETPSPSGMILLVLYGNADHGCLEKPQAAFCGTSSLCLEI